MRAWFVGLTKDQQEMKAAAELRAQGYTVYLPKHYVRHQDGRKVEARAVLRFTGYIFLAFDPARDEHGPISNTRGMDGSDGSALICDGAGQPQPLPAGIIEVLRAIEDEEFHRARATSRPRPRTDLVPGDKVMITGDRDHAAFGRKGVLVGIDRGVATVFEGWARWQVPAHDLKKVEAKETKAA
jgi:transcriptional antiterminator RfaH